MAHKPTTRTQPTTETVKTTVELARPLWEAAKLRAVKERRDLRSVIHAALEAYLGVTASGRPRR